MNKLDLTGMEFGRWSVIGFAGISKGGNSLWVCECSCGNKRNVLGTLLKNNKSKSCGCFARDEKIARKTTHGMSYSDVYAIWNAMKNRCFNKNTINYKDYGGRGITVCERWKNSFENFYSDMGERPSKNHSIHRKNNDGNYCPENCVWETDYEQQRQKRNVVILNFLGQQMTIPEIATKYNMTVSTLRRRLNKGLSIEDALIIPVVLGGEFIRKKLHEKKENKKT